MSAEGQYYRYIVNRRQNSERGFLHMYTGNYECLELFVKPEAGKKGSVSLKKVKENKTEIKELQHIYGNWIKFPTDKDTEYEITAQDCTITFAYLSELSIPMQ